MNSNNSIMPTYCGACLAENVVAVVGGPTCRHSNPSGLAWWPNGWMTMPEADRIEWLKRKGGER